VLTVASILLVSVSGRKRRLNEAGGERSSGEAVSRAWKCALILAGHITFLSGVLAAELGRSKLRHYKDNTGAEALVA
jgi:hypothetical protein